MVITNDDFTHWRKIMGAAPISDEERENMKRTITKPRPGHADLVGGMKYNHRDLRNVLERSSARETAARSGRCTMQSFIRTIRYRNIQSCC